MAWLTGVLEAGWVAQSWYVIPLANISWALLVFLPYLICNYHTKLQCFLPNTTHKKYKVSWYKVLVVPAAAKALQSCPTLCDPIDGSPPGSPVPGILQARTLEWVAISFSNAWKWNVKVKLLSCVRLFATPWTVAYQAPPSMGFSRQEYWRGVPLPSPAATIEEWIYW